MKKFVLLVVIFFLTALSVNGQNFAEIKQKVKEANKLFAKAMIENDYETMHAMYAENILSLPSYQPMIRGLDAIKEMSEVQKQSGWTTKNFVLNTTDIIAAGQLVIEIGNYDILMSMPGDTGEWADVGKYVTVWEVQEDGQLKIRVETWNTDNNPWEGMEGEHLHDEEDSEHH